MILRFRVILKKRRGREEAENGGELGADDLQNALNNAELSIENCPVSAESLGELAAFADEGKINSSQAKEVFAEMFAKPGKRAAQVVEERGMKQESDIGAIEALCDQAIANTRKP